MTIKFIDTQAQAQYEEARERYQERVDELMQKPGSRWPEDLRPPNPPEPMADSADPVFCNPNNYAVAPSSPYTPQIDAVQLDGNSQGKVKGFDSTWSSGRDADTKPFSNLKKG